MIERTRSGQAKAARILFFAAAAVIATSAILAACGGSASESPWPVEPERVVTDPEGEDGRRPSRNEIPDAGKSDAPPNVEP